MSLNKSDICKMLTANCPPAELSVWLREAYFPELKNRFNAEDSRKRFGLYKGEKIPTNERNLTDVRTRLGVLIEFELARLSNELLSEFGIHDFFWSYVVANRFPDLEVRHNNGDRFLRIEVKCLQCIAEEKAANFDTLLKDVDPRTDYVVVCTWDWNHGKSPIYDWDAVPMIDKIYVFHAYSLTLMRDTYWLNCPPSDLGSGYQGFDIRHAVTCKKGRYAPEGGNYGKLMRIWDGNFKFRPKDSTELRDTEEEYRLFKIEIIQRGFEILAFRQLEDLGYNQVKPVSGAAITGYTAGDVAYFLSYASGDCAWQTRAAELGVLRVVVMRKNYKSNVFKRQSNSWEKIAGDVKPKKVITILRRL